MKKLLIVLVVIAMMLSLASVAFAASVNTYMGGRYYINYRSSNDPGKQIDENQAPWDSNDSFITMNWSLTVNGANNSFATIKWQNECWEQFDKTATSNNVVGRNQAMLNFLYAFGQTNMWDCFDWQYNTNCVSSTLIGQSSIRNGGNWMKGLNGIDSPAQYDPMYFNRPHHVIAVSFHKDSIKFNAEWQPDQWVMKDNMTVNAWTTAFTYLLDNGDIHAGLTGPTDIVSGSSYIVGTKLKLESLGTLKADYYCAAGWDGTLGQVSTTTNSQFQADLAVNNIKSDFILAYFMPNSTKTDQNFFGIKYTYTGIDKIGLSAAYYGDDAKGNHNGFEAFGTYNVGAFNLRLGWEAPNPNKGGYVSLGVYGNMW